MRGFVQYDRTIQILPSFNGPPSFRRFAREKSKKEKAVGGKARNTQGRKCSRRARDWDHRNVMGYGLADESKSRVRYTWRPCLGHEGNTLTLLEAGDDRLSFSQFVVFKIRRLGCADPVVAQELLGCPRILRSDEVGFLQYPDAPKRHIL